MYRLLLTSRIVFKIIKAIKMFKYILIKINLVEIIQYLLIDTKTYFFIITKVYHLMRQKRRQ